MLQFITMKAFFICLFLFFFTTRPCAATPTVDTITPASGSSNVNLTVTFKTTYSDPSGWTHINRGYFLASPVDGIIYNSP